MSSSEPISNHPINQYSTNKDGLQNNDQLLKAVFNITAIGIAVVDEAGMLVEVNDRFCHMFGYERSELVGKHHTILHIEEEQKAAMEDHLAFFSGPGSQEEKDWNGITKNMDTIIVSCSSNLLVQENGQRFKVKSIRDVTKERRTEQLLEVSRIKHKAIFDNSLQAFFLTKPDGTILEANRAACAMFGYTEEELCKIGRQGIIDHADKRVAEKIEERKTTGVAAGELTGIRKNGERFPIEFSSCIFTDRNGEQHTSTVITDITKRKEQEKQLLQSQREMASILNNTEEIFMIIDSEYRLVNYNKAAEDRSAELLSMPLKRGESILQWADPERYQLLKGIYDRVLKGETIRYKHTLSKNPEAATLQLSYSPVVNEDGLCDRFMISVRDITIEENALKTIISKQEVLAQTEAIAHVGSWELDLTTNQLHWSDEVFRICGYEPGSFEVNFEKGLAVIHPDDQASSVAEMQQAILEKRDYAATKRFVRADGNIRYIVSRAKTILNNEGDAVRMVGVFHDITELREIERELAISQLEYKTLFEQHPDAVVSFDLKGKFTSVNDAALELAEASREQLLKSDFVQYIDIDSVGDVDNYFQNVKKGKSQRFESVIITSTNKRKSVNVILLPIYIHQEVTGVYGVLKDITLEKLHAEELEFQSKLLDTIQQSVIVTKLDGTIIYWNKFAEKLYGWKREEVMGVNVMNVAPTEMSIELGAEIMTKLAKGESWSGEFLVKHKMKGAFTAQIHNSPVTDASGELAGIIGISWDITERKQFEQQKELDRLDKDALINTTTDLIWSVGIDYKLIAANRAFVDSLKRTDNLNIKPGDDVLLESVFPQEFVSFWRNHYARALAGESFTIELHSPAKGSVKEHWDEIIFNPITKNNEVIAVACRGRDITQNKIYQQELLAINNQLEMAQQIAKLGYWSHDLQKDVLFWSKEVYKIFGVEESNFSSNFSSFAQYVHPDDAAEFHLQKEQAIRGERPVYHEHRIITPAGEVKYVIQKGAIIKNEAGETIRAEGTVQDVTESKLAQQALQLNEEQLNLIYNSTAGIIFLLGVENNGESFRFISMNNAGLTTIGVTEEQLFNKPVQEVIPEPSLSLVLSKYKEAVRSGKQVVWEEETAYPTGTKTGIVTVTPICNSEGVCIRLVGSVNDITELKKIERSLAISQQEYKSLFDQNPDAVYSLDLQGRFTSFNPGLEKLLECCREEIEKAETFVPFCHPDDLEKTMQYFIKVQHGEAQTYEVRAITFKGHQKYLSVSNMPIVVNGVITGIYGIAKDVTSEQLALAQLELSNERYEYATKATNDVIWDWDLANDKVVRAGTGFYTMFGYNEKEANLDDMFWMKKVHPGDRENVLQKRQLVFGDPKQDFWEDEYRFLRSNGEYAYVYDRGFIFRDNEGKPVRMIGATKDITEQKRSELQLKDLYGKLEERASQLQLSNTELERFAYIASHDLQEPLRMVSSFLQLLQKKYNDSIDEKGKEYIRFAVDGSIRMKRLINDLLDYSRVSTRKQQLEKVDMQLVMQEVLQNLGLQIEEKRAVIEVGKMPVLTWADKTQMVQLLQNLVGNALKYSDQQPPLVQISVKEENNEWQFAVKDNGIGFEQKFAEKIFVIFQRLHNKTEYSGTGIGLAICKKIVDRHGGTIRVESEPGKGSIFYFTISKQLTAEN